MTERTGIGNSIAPWPFMLFVGALVVAVPVASHLLGDLELGAMAGFDAAALLFLASVAPLLGVRRGPAVGKHAHHNVASRALLLVITAVVLAVLLLTIAAEAVGSTPEPFARALIVVTMLLAWLFSNTVYALHYAHLAYWDPENGCAGLAFPGTDRPDYWDFVYFAFGVGMTFQTSDVTISSNRIRRVVTVHALAAFIFNIGVLAFTINVLGSR